MKLYKILVAIIILAFFFPQSVVLGQNQDDYPIYIVQEGDTLTSIAQKFGISSQDIIDANNLANPDVLLVGSSLVIPSLAGISGTLTTSTIPFGQKISDLSLTYALPVNTIARINRLTSPVEVYAGAPLILPQRDDNKRFVRIASMHTGESLLELSVKSMQNPWGIKSQNNSKQDWEFLNGDIIYSSSQDNSSISVFSPDVKEISVAPLPLKQGETVSIRVATTGEMILTGSLQGNPLNFFENAPGEYVALQGIYRNADTGLTTLKISGQNSSGTSFSLEQSVLVQHGYFRISAPLTVPPETIDPKNTQPEEDYIRSLITPASPMRLWSGIFKPANNEPDCITAWFGDERVYNGTFKSFHTGIDYGVCVIPSLDIYAPAAGRVIYTGSLTIRGNATIIDHGWGVYSGIYHQKEVYVKVGDMVEQGQLIGLIGDTGRVSGPHLHWEIWVGGQLVNPQTWLENTFP